MTPPKLLGNYKTPKFRIGDVVNCARRGEVRIVGLSDAPIPWPLGQLPKGGRRPALLLSGDLAEAVRRESAEAVTYFWGVKANTVWQSNTVFSFQYSVFSKTRNRHAIAPAGR